MKAREAFSSRFGAVVIAAIVIAGAIVAGSETSGAFMQSGHQHDATPGNDGHDHMHGTGGHAGMAGHTHAEVPTRYRTAHIPAAAWTDPAMLEQGKAIYASRCAVCHGDEGDGKGPAATALPVKPPDFRDAGMIDKMQGNYWFWRVSEGGSVEPFRSQGSAMPPWKGVLSEEERWAVIAYEHTFSGHHGPHVVSEHPQMVVGEDMHQEMQMPSGGPSGGATGSHSGHAH